MRLNRIKLSGFKSFVDPTTIELPGNLIAVVGPNGCGKSNVIDAVRWVMGESSAKTLRGDSLADVIFNGSSARKPVGTATIELIFDNHDGSIGGQYASYSEISIKRLLSRDGTSQYFLNNTRCRRKDITGIFLGTGLGPRSYAIIEQGMISRLIEARPEDLRVYLEEAAGISKYKARRRETETRIRHTRDNLDRLNDLRDEVEKQLKHLQRQAAVAEKYRTYKDEQRRSAAELLALRLRDLDQNIGTEHQRQLEHQTALESCVADQRAVETEIEKTRDRHNQASDAANKIQERYYSSGAEIARLEQQIQHTREMRKRQQADLEETTSGLDELRALISRDQATLSDLETSLHSLEPDLQRAREEEHQAVAGLEQAETAMEQWRERWNVNVEELSNASQLSEVTQTRIGHLESSLQEYRQRATAVRDEREGLSVSALEEELGGIVREANAQNEFLGQLQRRLTGCVEDLRGVRTRDRELTGALDEKRAQLQQAQGRLASLEALQQAALGENRKSVTEWLEAAGLGARARLGQVLSVDAGWERAVETVLGDYLEAVCVDGHDAVESVLGELPESSVGLVVTGQPGHSAWRKPGEPLSSRVRGDLQIDSLLDQVFIADTLDDAMRIYRKLGSGQSVITRDGIWIGRDWLRVSRDEDAHAGVLAREEEMRQLRSERDRLSDEIEQLDKDHSEARERLVVLEAQRETVQTEVNQVHRSHAAVRARVEERQQRLGHLNERINGLESTARSVSEKASATEEALRTARSEVEQARNDVERLTALRTQLEAERERLTSELTEAREQATKCRQAAQALAIEVESRRSTRSSAGSSLERMQSQQEQLLARREELRGQLSEAEQPLTEADERLKVLLDARMEIERELTTARRDVDDISAELRRLDETRLGREQAVQAAREALDVVRMATQEVRVRRDAIAEQFAATTFDLEELQKELPESASADDWAERLEKLEKRIARLGAINLAAIDEFREQSERKEYLDAQLEDLVEALETLERAIRKIDKETRGRFKETFDKVDSEFQRLFPQLFGGGTAYLELTGDDLLNAGVTVMARPPGKRNSTIHLLSGGEKALTAVALVFAIFQLNPAPFCMLDEVDAPLDDANVGRFCEIVRSMSENVQFVVITHNKTTMEMANQLMGVTMQEPGVSRLVAVDVDEAVEMAAM